MRLQPIGLTRMLMLMLMLAPAGVHAAARPAADAAAPLADYQHTRWSAENGAPPRVRAMAQTADGWLWLGTADGLYRFDGQRFTRYALPPRQGPGVDRILHLFAAPDGDLYISYFAEGITVLHADGRAEALPAQPPEAGAAETFALDGDGSVWTIGLDVRRLRHGRWEQVAAGPEWNDADQNSLVRDGAGLLWATGRSAVWRLDRASGRFLKVADGRGDLLPGPDGRLWRLDPDGGMHLLDAGADANTGSAGRTRARTPFGQGQDHWLGQFDADGALWLLNCPDPVCLVPGAGARRTPAWRATDAVTARMTAPAGLSGQEANRVLVDREGVIWIATERGLDRFRPNRFLGSGLPGSGVRYSLAVDGAGQAWAADIQSEILWRLQPGAAPQRAPGRTTLVAKGRDGALLVGMRRTLQRRRGDTVEEIALPPGPDGAARDHHLVGILDDGKVLWTTTLETGLIGWRDGRWHARADFNLPAKIYQSAPAGPGQLWLATGDGALVFYDDGRLTTFDIRPLGMATSIFPGSPLTISGTAGMGVLKDGRLHMLRTADPALLHNVSGMVVTPDGDRWLNGAAGLVHVRADDWRRAMLDPGQELRCDVFDGTDGYPGQAVIETRWPSAVTADGRNLWLVGSGGVVRVDTAVLRRGLPAPASAILAVVAGNTGYPVGTPAGPAIALPAGTEQFRIEYTAPALRTPERQRFTYRLDGVDGRWLDAGMRRATTYTNIGPGHYTFHVRAVDDDGLGSGPEATVRLHVAPLPTQTLWFRVACAAGVMLLGVLLYRYRVRYLTGRLTEQLQVRTAERERIARTLHDTFLQTVQGLVLRVDAVAAMLPPGHRARSQLERVLDDASQAIGEGRDQLQALRAGDAPPLEDALADAVARVRATHARIAVELRVEGARRVLQPDAAVEIAEIGAEALRNAFAHSGAAQVRVVLGYGRRTLTLCVADNGRGIPAHVLRTGTRAGHWGLVGMRERAAHLGAQLQVDSAAGTGDGAGTTVMLTVPAAQAYLDP
jgi:signal transduction histidine kinase